MRRAIGRAFDLWEGKRLDGGTVAGLVYLVSAKLILRGLTAVILTVGIFSPQIGIAGSEDDRDETRRLDPDRPHLPEASTAVGKGHVVLESGYTFAEKGSVRTHSYPEAVLRVGMFADWFELRIGQNFVTQAQTVGDLYVGAKLALTEQRGYLPAIAVIPQMTVTDANRADADGRVLPGLNVDCGWELLKDRFAIELLIATNRVRDDAHGSHLEVATGLTAVVNLRRDLEAFVEWDAFYPVAASGPASGARDYAVGGLVYFITDNLAVDVRAGVGLNRQANDFLAGAGFSVRY
jgi:hypothetical protein